MAAYDDDGNRKHLLVNHPAGSLRKASPKSTGFWRYLSETEVCVTTHLTDNRLFLRTHKLSPSQLASTAGSRLSRGAPAIAARRLAILPFEVTAH
jgi:hypothetical protein